MKHNTANSFTIMPCHRVRRDRSTLTSKESKHRYGGKQGSPLPDAADDDARVRTGSLRRGAGKEYLYMQEVFYVFRYHFYGRGTPPRAAVPVVIAIDDAASAADAFLNTLGNEKGAIVYSLSAGHYCAVYSFVSDDGRMRMALYDPMGDVSPTVLNKIRAAVAIVNGSSRKADVMAAAVGWQKSGGPCGVYSAFILRCLVAGGADPSGMMEPSGCPNPPTLADVKRVYVWLADNLEESQRKYYASL
jgi:hypothetical protein